MIHSPSTPLPEKSRISFDQRRGIRVSFSCEGSLVTALAWVIAAYLLKRLFIAMSQPLAPLETRVQHSLARTGFNDVKVTHLGEGVIKLELVNIPPQSKPMVIAVVRTVAGVMSVST